MSPEDKELNRKYNTFIKEKNDNIKIKKLVGYYKEVCDHIGFKLKEILNYFNNYIEFLNKNKDKIKSIIDSYKSEELSKDEAAKIMSTIKNLLFSKTFQNYFLEIIALNGSKNELKDIILSLTIARESDEDSIMLNKKVAELTQKTDDYSDAKTTNQQYMAKFQKKKDAINDEGDGEGEGDDKEKPTDVKSALSIVDDTDTSSELQESKKRLKEVFLKFFDLRKTKYWWGEIKDTIKKEIEAIDTDKTLDDSQKASYRAIINIFLKEFLKTSVEAEIKVLEITKDTDKDLYKNYLNELKNSLETKSDTVTAPTTSYDGIEKDTYEDILNYFKTNDGEQDDTSVLPRRTITKTDMIKLTSSLIILLKFQLYELYSAYTDVITKYNFDSIIEDIYSFQIDFAPARAARAAPAGP
jgi:hypothetical protein